MKKILTCLLAAALITASLSGCVGSVREDTINELDTSYQADEYYAEQQKEIDDIIAEYSDKINNSSSKDEIAKLKDECIEKINDVDKKEAALEKAKTNAEEALASVKGLLLPYKETSAALTTLNEKYEAMENPAEINAAADELKAIVEAASTVAVYKYDINGISFDVEVKYSVNGEGIPVATLKSTAKWSELDFTGEDYTMFEFAAMLNTSIDQPSIERMLSCNAFSIRSGKTINYLDESFVPSSNPSKARMKVVDEYTYEVEILTSKQLEALNSDSETFTNSDGITTDRNADYKNPLDYIIIAQFNGSNSGDEYTFTDRILWAVIL